MDDARAVRVSKFLSLVLRHEPSAAGLALDANGWAEVEALLRGSAGRGFPITREELGEVVRTSDKKRFALSEDGSRIRASQGHSVGVDLGLEPVAPPPVLYHGTVEAAVAGILAAGIEKRSRQYVHLSSDVATATKVGARRGSPVILAVAAGRMHEAGLAFYRSENGVWLTEHVPPAYVSRLP